MSSTSGYYQRLIKRGTNGIYHSQHFESLRKNFQYKDLRSNYWGPKEWFVLAKYRINKMKNKSPSQISQMTRKLKAADPPAPDVYPFIPNGESEKDVAEQRKRWEKYRHACAGVFRNSPFEIEERVMDAWNYFVSGKESVAQNSGFYGVGGFKVSIRDLFQKRQEYIPLHPLNTPACHKLYLNIQSCANPWSRHKLPVTMQQFLKSIQTRADVYFILPAFLQRWRWKSMGDSKYATPNEQITDNIIQICIRKNSPETAVHLLRYKSVYKLSPSIKTIKDLMAALLLQHVNYDAALYEPLKYQVVKQEKILSVQELEEKKRAEKKYPFRSGPRFYYYKPLPFTLLPEPSVFSEFELPRLILDAGTRRLLPDDQRKKLHMMIETLEKQEKETTVKEEGAIKALTDMYRLFFYVTDSNPRYYGEQLALSKQDKTTLMDLLVLAGSLGGSEEGKRRSLITAKEALDCQLLSDAGMFGASKLDPNLVTDKVQPMDEYFKTSSLLKSLPFNK